MARFGAIGPDAVAVSVWSTADNVASTGSAYLNALQLRIEQINASGQLGDRRLVLRSMDNRSDTSVSGRNIYVDNLYGNGVNATIQPLLSAAQITVTATQSVNPSAVDITETVGTLIDGEPPALLVLTGPDQAILAATSAKTAKFAGRLLLDAEAAGDPFIPQRASAAMDNATMVFTETPAIGDVVATTPAKASRQEWFTDYASRYGSYSGVAAFAADAADLIAAGVVRAGTNRSGIREVIEAADRTNGSISTSSLAAESGFAAGTGVELVALSVLPQVAHLAPARSGQRPSH